MTLPPPTTAAGDVGRPADAAVPGPIEMLGAFDSTYQPAWDVDLTESTGHHVRWRADLELLKASGVTRLRYPVRWHRVESRRGRFDWGHTDQVLGWLHDNGMRPVIDILHHTSYPRWVGDLSRPGFGPAYLRYAEAVARRYPWVEEYTLFNEPFTTFLLCGHEGIWAPYLKGIKGMLRLIRNFLPAVAEASRMYCDLLPRARHVYLDTCERHTASRPQAQAFTDMANDRRFFVTDLFLGRPLEANRPFVDHVLRSGGEDVLAMEAGHVDVLGLDYYAHNQWHWDAPGRGVTASPVPASLAELIGEYWQRYRLPCMLAETNIRGFASDRASWLKYTLEQCEVASAAGVPIDGYCWFPFVDSCDWDSILARADGHIDPVGVYWIDDRLERRASSMSRSWAMAARGAPAKDLPAYRFQPPVIDWLHGFLPHMRQWDWERPPAAEVRTDGPPVHAGLELRIPHATQ